METSRPTFRQLALPAAFVLLTGLLLIAAFKSFGGSLPLSAKGYRVWVPVDSAANLVPGSDVQVSGVTIGRVTEITGSREPRLEIELEDDQAPLARDARATVRTKTLLGEGYVELSPGNPDRGTLPEGGALAASQITPRVQLDEFLETFDEGTRASTRRLIRGLSGAFEGRAGDLNEAAGSLAPTAASMRDVLGILDAQRDQAGQLVKTAGDVFTALGERHGAVQQMLTGAERVLTATASRDAELERTVRAFPAFLGQVEKTATTVAAASGDLGTALRAVRRAAPHLAPALKAIDGAAPEFQRLFAALPRTQREARTGLPALSRTAKAAVPAFEEMWPALRHVIPSIDLLSQNSRELTAVMANLASTLNGRILGPGNQVLPNASATVFLSNETLLGYKHRLPTNRLNPYIKPGGLDEMAKRGHLLAYDCRHTKNPLLAPPIGLGVPPCVEQGPWEFRGKTRYFPVLEMAAP